MTAISKWRFVATFIPSHTNYTRRQIYPTSRKKSLTRNQHNIYKKGQPDYIHFDLQCKSSSFGRQFLQQIKSYSMNRKGIKITANFMNKELKDRPKICWCVSLSRE